MFITLHFSILLYSPCCPLFWGNNFHFRFCFKSPPPLSPRGKVPKHCTGTCLWVICYDLPKLNNLQHFFLSEFEFLNFICWIWFSNEAMKPHCWELNLRQTGSFCYSKPAMEWVLWLFAFYMLYVMVVVGNLILKAYCYLKDQRVLGSERMLLVLWCLQRTRDAINKIMSIYWIYNY